MSDQTGLYQDGNSVFENVFIQGTLNVATKNEKLVVHSDGITIDTITTNSDGKTTFTGDVQINGDEFFISDSIKHVGDTDTLISFPSNDTINFRTNGTERFRIADNGRVGINSASPAATLDVRDVGSTGPGILISGGNSTEGDLTIQDGEIFHIGHFNSDTDTYTDRFRIDTSGVKQVLNGNLNITSTYIDFSGNYNSGLLGQTAPSSTDAAIYRPQDNTLCFSTDSAERLRIDSGGNVEIAAGHVSLHLGHGIDFSDTANGTGTTSSEIFDDYEEGSFTPSYNTTNSNIGSVTYDARTGRYIKVGRLCFITIRLRTDNISSVGSGTIRITGLPFTHVNQANGRAVSNNLFTSNWTGNNSPTQVLIQNNQTYMNLYQKDYNNDTASLPVSAWNTGANDNDIRLTAMYETST